MPSTYTQNLGLEKPATGEQAGVWGDTANNDYDFLDTGIDGSLHVALSASSYNLNTAQGAASQGRYKVIVWTGALTAQATVNITPNTAQKIYIMQNATSGGFAISFQQGTGGTFLLQPGSSAIIYCDGAGPAAQVSGALYNVQFGSVLVQASLTVAGSVNFQQPATFTQPVTFSNTVALNAGTTINGLLTMNVQGQANAAYDLYYRHPTGPMVPLPIGAPGQMLQVQPGPGIGWATVSLAIGSSVVGSAAYEVYYSNASNQLAQDNWVRINPGVGLGIGLTPARSLHIGYNYPPEIWLDTNNSTAQQRQLVFASNGVPRWLLYTPAQAEGGGNAGSNLNLVAYNDAGSATTQAISFWRANGNITIGAYGDQGAKLSIFASAPSQPPLIVQGVAGQNFLQVWRNSDGATMASIDGNGVLFLNSASFLTVNQPSGRLNLYGTVPGSPWGCIHIGPEPSTTSGLAGIRGAIAMQTAASSTDAVPNGVIRFYYRNGAFVIQFYWNGQNYYAYLILQGQQGPAQWFIGPNPM